MYFLKNIESILSSQAFVLSIVLISVLLKLLIIIFTLNQRVDTQIMQRLRLLLLIILGTNILSDVVWIQVLLKNMGIIGVNPRLSKFIGRLAWASIGIQYQGLALFIEGLITRKHKLNIRQQLCSIVSLFLVLASS